MGTWCETRICRSSSAAGRYNATESKETKDTGRSGNLVFGHPTDQGTVLLLSHSSPFSTHPEEEPACDSDTEQASATLNGRKERKGDVASWRSFAENKWS